MAKHAVRRRLRVMDIASGFSRLAGGAVAASNSTLTEPWFELP